MMDPTVTDPTPIAEIVKEFRERHGIGPDTPEQRALLEAADLNAEKAAQIQTRLEDVPPKFVTADVKDFDADVRAVVEPFIEDPGAARGLLIYGPTGVGKTRLLWAIYRGLARSLGPRMRIVKVVRVFEQLKPGGDEDPHAQMTRLLSTSVLGLDDLAVGKHTEWEQKRLYELVDGRYDTEMPLVITTNRKPSALADPGLLGDRTASRLKEACDELKIVGADRRYG